MRIALDLGGGPLHPVLAGALDAAETGEHELRLFGPEEAIRAELASLGASENARIAVYDAPGVLSPDEDLQAACRDRRDASLLNAAACAASGEADAFVSAAPPRTAVAAALWHFKRLPGVLKPAAACLLPARERPVLFLDAGSASDCKPWHLLQFGLMGSLLARTLFDRRDPTVAVLASGNPVSTSDESRAPRGASELVREAIPLLKYAGLRFEGPIEAHAVMHGGADVVVTDGDTGEVVCGALKGLADLYSIMLESSVAKNPVRRFGAALARPALKEAAAAGFGVGTGGTAILGVGGTTVLCAATRREAAAAVETAVKLERSEFRKRLQARLADVKAGMESRGAIESP